VHSIAKRCKKLVVAGTKAAAATGTGRRFGSENEYKSSEMIDVKCIVKEMFV
jgi:hypothetical protein